MPNSNSLFLIEGNLLEHRRKPASIDDISPQSDPRSQHRRQLLGSSISYLPKYRLSPYAHPHLPDDITAKLHFVKYQGSFIASRVTSHPFNCTLTVTNTGGSAIVSVPSRSASAQIFPPMHSLRPTPRHRKLALASSPYPAVQPRSISPPPLSRRFSNPSNLVPISYSSQSPSQERF